MVGCGDVGLRLLAQLTPRQRSSLAVLALSRRATQREAARALGARAFAVELDERRALHRLAAFCDRVVYLAPPPDDGEDDPRLARFIAGARTHLWRVRGVRRAAKARWVYVGTTGVYGDCAGALVEESHPVAPASARARRRVAAEQHLRALAAAGAASVALLRAPGIYAHDRLPAQRLRAGLPVPSEADDIYTNHVHAEDLARAAWLALARGRPGRAYNAVDDSTLKLGEYFDLVARALALSPPPRLPREAIAGQSSRTALSYLDESRRLVNRRLVRELRWRLRWPTVADTLRVLHEQQGPRPPQAARPPQAPDRARSTRSPRTGSP